MDAPPALNSTVFLKTGSFPLKVIAQHADGAVTCEGQDGRRTYAPADLTTEDTSAAWEAERRKAGAF